MYVFSGECSHQQIFYYILKHILDEKSKIGSKRLQMKEFGILLGSKVSIPL